MGSIIDLLIKDEEERKAFEEFDENQDKWKKLLSRNQISNAFAKVTAEADLDFLTVMLIATITAEALSELFPKEEYEAMFGPIGKKGEKNGSK